MLGSSVNGYDIRDSMFPLSNKYARNSSLALTPFENVKLLGLEIMISDPYDSYRLECGSGHGSYSSTALILV